jgi:outer membrane protein assembly factor BamD
MGEALKKVERYDEAAAAYQKIADDYPTSKLAAQARYEAAYCAYMASLKPAYDAGPTDKAIEAFEEFASTNKDSDLAKEADKTVYRLKDKAAEKSLLTAQFYEQQKKYRAAVVYYQDIIDRFPESSYANLAKIKIQQLKKKVK